MKKKFPLIFSFLAFISFGQIQENAPWAKDLTQQNRNNSKPTLQEVSAAAEAYFSTIDVNKKGSGYKPFKRWEYNWSKFLNPDGTIQSKEDLWKAWEEKQAMNRTNNRNSSNRMTDVSNWEALGPFMNSNTYSASNQKQTGQGRVNAIAIDPSNSNTFYVGTPAGGIWKSTDAGVNWTPLTDYLPQIGVSGIAIHPTNSNIIYIATGDDDANDSNSVGVWKSIDGGTTWNNTGAIPGTPNITHEIYIHPNNPETILVATSSGVMKTTNGGDTWTNKLSGNIRDLKVKANDPSVWYAVTNNSFHRSSDTGESFINITLPNLGFSTRLAMDVGGDGAGSDYVYVVSAGSGSAYNAFYKSTNSGQTFTKSNTASMFGGSNQAWFDLALTVSSSNPEIVYVGVLDIYKSTNGGDSFFRLNNWSNPNQNSYTHADIHFLRFIDGKFLAGTDGGIFVSTDEGINFIDLTKNLAISQFYRISVSPQDSQIINGGLQDNGGYGLDGQWRNYHGGDGMEGIVDPTNKNNFYGFMQFGQNLFYSRDGGRTLAGAVGRPAGENGEWITPLTPDSQGVLYAGFNQLHKLENNNWTKVSNHFFGGSLDIVEIDPNNEDNIYVSNGSSLFRSTDKGINFQNIPISIGTINSIEVSNNDSNTVWFATNFGVHKSINILSSSPTFSDITGNLPSENKRVVKHHERSGNNTIYVGTNLGVYYINDDISDWVDFDNNLPNTQVRDLAINEDDSKLIAATYGRGVFISDIPRQLPANDVRLLSIDNPSAGINCTNTIIPEITIKNQGTNEINSATVNYNIDGGSNSSFDWSGNLSSEETISITLPQISNLSVGNHNLEVDVTINNDTYSSNNKTNVSFITNLENVSPTTVNSFEASENELIIEATGSNVWERGSVNKALLSTPTGSNAYATKLTGNYPDQTIGYLYTNCYNLTNMSNPELAFKMGFDIENEWDYLTVEYSTDFGTTWTVLGTANDPNWYNSSATTNSTGQATLPGAQWTGEGEDINPNDNLSNATIRDYSYDLAAFTNETNIIFRFNFFADQNTNEEGVVIDDMVINGVLSTDSFNLLNNIAIYPNPSESIFNLNWNTGDTLDIKVYDITGKQVFTKRNITNNSYQLDLGSFAQGIYLLNMNMNGKTATKKLVLK